MTNALRFSLHALDRMEERGITRQEVQFILKYGEAREAPTKHGKPQRWLKEEFIRGHKMRVVYIESPGWTDVITVMWVYETIEGGAK